MVTCLVTLSKRGVRSLNPHHFRPPWPFVSKAKGWRKIGPTVFERHKRPGQDREFPELSPKFLKQNPPELAGYTGVCETGYKDASTGRFVHVEEMRPELIVPDLSGFNLRPYVSYRTDVEIETKLMKYENMIRKRGSEASADSATFEGERWPPSKVTAKSLFKAIYAPTVRQLYSSGEYFKNDA